MQFFFQKYKRVSGSKEEIEIPGGGGTRMFRVYQARPKIHLIRVIFQDQAMYARTLFRGAKMCKTG